MNIEIAPQSGGSYMRDATGALTRIDESDIADTPVAIAMPDLSTVMSAVQADPALTTNTQE